MTGKSFRCPACKTILSVASASPAPEDDPESDEPEIPTRSQSLQKAPSSRVVPPPSRERAPREEVLEEVADSDEEKPIREKRPRKKRPLRKKSSTGLIVGLAAGGLVLLLLVLGVGGGLAWYFLRNKTIPQSEWQTFSPANSGCTVLMPGMPAPQTMNMMGILAKTYQMDRTKENAVFALSIFEIPPQFVRPSLLEDVATNSRAGALARMDPGSKVASESAISLGNIPGREYQIKPPTRGTMIARIYLAKLGEAHRVYLVMAGGDFIQPNTGDAARFFDSFKLDATAAPPKLDAAAPQIGAQPPPDIKPPQPNPQPNQPRPNPGRRQPRTPRRPL